MTTINVNSNFLLKNFQCYENQLTSIDISNNLLLEVFECNDNFINCIDISNNTALINVLLDNNLLEQLNTRNGNFHNMYVSALNNNLTCVEVDNIGTANNDWDFDNFALLTTNCNYTNPCTSVSAIQEQSLNKELLKVTDLLGREVKEKNNVPLLYLYDDGTVEKRIVIE